MAEIGDMNKIMEQLAGAGCKTTSVKALADLLKQQGVTGLSEDTLASALTQSGVRRDDKGAVSVDDFVAWAFGGSAPAKDYGRVWNFSAGPSVLPLPLLERIHKDFMNYHGTAGCCVMEMSHRSKEMINIFSKAEKDYRDLQNIPDDYKVIFQQGGATGAYAAIPMNMMGTKTGADYLVTGRWGDLAWKEFDKYGKANAACHTKNTKFTNIPKPSEWKLDPEAAYVHYCVNETVHGVEFFYYPDVGNVPLVADISSMALSRPFDFSKHAAVYAGIQKNMGPAGMSVTAVRPDFASGKSELKICPSIWSWKGCAEGENMPNTPSCWATYVMGEYLQYSKELGGIPYWDEIQSKKVSVLYDAIESTNGFYKAPVEKDCRSRINVPFIINGNDEDMTKKFLKEAAKVKLYTLAGHRSIGGIRASMYNGMPLEGVQCLADFMKSFYDENRT